MQEQTQIHNVKSSQDIQLKEILKDSKSVDKTSARSGGVKDFEVSVDVDTNCNRLPEFHASSIVKNPPVKASSAKHCPVNQDLDSKRLNWLTRSKTLARNSTWLLLLLVVCILIGIVTYACLTRSQNAPEMEKIENKKKTDQSVIKARLKDYSLKGYLTNLNLSEQVVTEVSLEEYPSSFNVSKQVVTDNPLKGYPSSVNLTNQVATRASLEEYPFSLNLSDQVVTEVSLEKYSSNLNLSDPVVTRVALEKYSSSLNLSDPVVTRVSLEEYPSSLNLSDQMVTETSIMGAASFLMPITYQLEQTNAETSGNRNNELFHDVIKSNATKKQENSTLPPEHQHNKGNIKDKKETLNQLRFTSGHQNNFGIPIEEDERILGLLNAELIRLERHTEPAHVAIQTEESAIVSPTIPPLLNSLFDSSTKFHKQDEEIQCQSVSLKICRGVLQYDLTSSNPNQYLSSLELRDIDQLISSNCSQRAAEFICSVFEPECRSSQIGGLQPCKRNCKSILEVCSNLILDSNILTFTFDCDKYPDSSNKSVCEDPTRRKDCYKNEFRCNDKSCIPDDWRCDNIKDCSDGEDESGCLDCNYDEFRCTSNEKCIPDKYRCDKENHCADGSDERDCSSGGDISDGYLHFGPHPFLNLIVRNDSKDSIFFTTSNEDRIPSESELDESFAVVEKGYEYSNDSVVIKEFPIITEYDLNNRSLDKVQDRVPRLMANDSETETEVLIGAKQNKPEQSDTVPSCIGDELRCVSGKCITVDQLCDKTIDCPEGEDELMCSYG